MSNTGYTVRMAVLTSKSGWDFIFPGKGSLGRKDMAGWDILSSYWQGFTGSFFLKGVSKLKGVLVSWHMNSSSLGLYSPSGKESLGTLHWELMELTAAAT